MKSFVSLFLTNDFLNPAYNMIPTWQRLIYIKQTLGHC